MLLAFWNHVEKHNRHPDGCPTSEVANFRLSLKPLRQLYGRTMAGKFGPLALKAIRKTMIDDSLARKVINQRIGRIRRAFKWAASEQLVPPSVYHGLLAVDGLKAGRTEAKELPAVEPVADERVAAVLPKVNRHVRGMIEIQRLTGMRPGEVCALRRSKIDMSAPVWLYRPVHHKTQHHGKIRIVAIGPRAQAILKQFFKHQFDDYLFSPSRAREERFAAMRAARASKVQPSQVSRRKTNPKRTPRERYSRMSYTSAIASGCAKAGIPSWHPNQLRHAFATEVRKRFGLEAAQVGLGHSRADATQIYAESNATLAAEIAMKVG